MMKHSKRILSFLMAIVILPSFLNMYAGAKAPYSDAAILVSQYDDLDKLTLTLNQSASLLLDFIDKKLKEKNDKDGTTMIDIGVLGTLNLSSVDNILDSIYGTGILEPFDIYKGFLGDLKDIDVSAVSTFRRSSAPSATADLNVVYSVIDYLSDNKTVFSKIIDGSADWGLLNEYVDLTGINISQTLKALLFAQATPGTAVPQPVNDTADSMIEQIVSNLITDAGAPEIAGSIDLNSDAVAYDCLEKLLQDVYNLVLVPLMNTDLKKAVREGCGVVYDPLNPADPGDETDLNTNAAILDIHCTVPVHVFEPGATVITDLNSILFEIVDAVTVGYTGWTTDGNSLALNNLAAALKYVLANTGSGLFADYVPVLSPDEINAMTSQQVFGYLLRSVLNSTVGTLNIPADADTLIEVAWYALKEVLAQKVPQNDYSAQPKTLSGILFMLADIGVYYINQIADMNPAAGTLPGAGLLAYGQGLDATITAVMNWFRINYGGLFNVTLSQTDGWAALDTLVFSVVPRNWLPADVTGCKDLLINRILRDVLDLNTTNLFALFDHRADSELAANTTKKVAIDAAARLVNIVFPAALQLNYTSFEQIIANTELQLIAEKLATQFYQRRAFIVPVLLPLLNKWIGIDAPQGFVNPALVLPKQIGAATTFTISNESMGLNTGATNKAGTFTQDALYKIKIVSLTSSVPAITLTNLVGTVINGGESVNCAIGGTFGANQVLMVTMQYDVYTELGVKLTDTPLTEMAFSFISGVLDDGKNYIALDTNSNNIHTSYYKSIYLNQDASLADIADMRVQVRREKTSTLNTYEATISRTMSTVNVNLVGVTAAAFTNATTTNDGGTWTFPVFTVDPVTAVRPADGAYTSTFTYSATKTSVTGNIETWQHSGKSYVVFYNDFGLPAMLSDELGKHRDPANYTDADAWSQYLVAMSNAVFKVYKPRQAATFMTQIAANYYQAKIALDEAVAALEACALLEDPYRVVPQVIDTFNPPNPPEMPYDDPDYNYFGLADFVPYTYLNYQREVANCQALLSAQQQISQIDIAYALHRLNLYAGRLISVQATKVRLNEVIAAAGSPVEAQYTRRSWAAFERAIAFATTINAQSTTALDGSGNYVLRQSKVNAAREKLVEAYKQLVLVCDYTQLDALISEAMNLTATDWTPQSWAILQAALSAAHAIPRDLPKTDENQRIIDEAADRLRDARPDPFPPDPFFYVWHDGPGGPGTGSTVDIIDNSERIVAVFTLVIFGDVNGDANIDSVDAGTVVDHENYLIVWYNPDDECYSLAADINNDGSRDSIDAGLIIDIENYVPVYIPPRDLPDGFIEPNDDIIIDDPIW